jgi:hypothetical protein
MVFQNAGPRKIGFKFRVSSFKFQVSKAAGVVAAMKFRFLPGAMRCSFCRRPNAQVEKLISNHPAHLPLAMRRAYICDACVAVCDAILQGDYKPLGGKVVHRVAGADSPRHISHCSFCRKPQHECGKLLHSRVKDRAICAACVAICNSILSGENPNSNMPKPVSEESIVADGVRYTQKLWWRFWRKISAIGFRVVSPKAQQAAASPAEGAAL